jgi:hypothetical protein
MTKDEIIEFAEKAGLLRAVFAGDEVLVWEAETKHLQRFAALVAEKEREACAYNAGIALLGADKGLSNRVDKAIKARGQK